MFFMFCARAKRTGQFLRRMHVALALAHASSNKLIGSLSSVIVRSQPHARLFPAVVLIQHKVVGQSPTWDACYYRSKS